LPKNDRGSPDHGRVKIRVIELEIDGSNASLLEGVRTIAATLSRGNGTGEPIRRVVASGVGRQAALDTGTAGDEATAEIEDSASDDEPIAEAPAPRRSKPRPAKLEVVQLDFLGSDGTSLRQFVEGVDVTSQTKKYMIIAVWLNQHLKKKAVNLNEIYSCYRHLDWNDFPTKSPRGVFKDLINKNQYRWMEAGEAQGTYAVNFIGIQKVDEWRKKSTKA